MSGHSKDLNITSVSYPLILRLPQAHLKKSLSTREAKHSEAHDLNHKCS